MITFLNVSKNYPLNGEEISILNNLTFTINKGDIFGVIGKTGEGKSTLLRLINGFITPDSGQILINGQPLLPKNRHELVTKTSMIFQNYNLLANLNVLDNVLLPSKLRKRNDEDHQVKAYDLLDFVGLKAFHKSRIAHLSGGQKQRVAIARALMSNPDIILCDEPTSALDEQTSFEVLQLLKKINEEYKTTIVLVAHDTRIIKMLCNKIALINEGKIDSIIERVPDGLTYQNYDEVFSNV